MGRRCNQPETAFEIPKREPCPSRYPAMNGGRSTLPDHCAGRTHAGAWLTALAVQDDLGGGEAIESIARASET